jgi:hypothetical protein
LCATLAGQRLPKLKKPAQPADHARCEKLHQTLSSCGCRRPGASALATSRCSASQGPEIVQLGTALLKHPTTPTCRWEGGSLSEQEPAGRRVHEQPRAPQDPRFKGSVKPVKTTMTPTTRCTTKTVNGHVLETLDRSRWVNSPLYNVPPWDASRSRMLCPHC